ncbi:MAG: hypothetical protein COW32_02860 [Candidatus Aquicultor secundus]|uniref:Preprotein translocase subunit SecB n=1 Tax=Candidatus Aquicultor secundus TaxID=1973895 RepID=A0A2M7T9M7_9ACTN|nr:protein-export chaperone SecB [Candidatus Aquicultor secundus]PIU26014.1 MAG: hypothetical protein COT10_10910 [Candidatus Aquicultor secundus]PIW22768.1 MAG: hypothetical protein COW32_02860 [Candidatus Aquicultor secundus]PIY40525.1 MAG: hypothetical protein COZ03_03980 [Candidatus Aquicultor secundus]PIZ40372.1 MAG: hypothetical protein COY37_03880 [Candidatus Aquicultor secundus]
MAEGIIAKLKMLDYTIFKLAFEVSPAFQKEPSQVELGLDSNVGINKDNELNYRIDIIIKINEDELAYEEAGFRLSAELAGIFEFAPETTKEEIDKMIGLNGLSMLFSTARGVIAQLTAQSPIGKFVLPSVNIAEFLRQRAEELAKEAESKKK